MVDVLFEQNIVPGIKVDKDLVPLADSNDESWYQGPHGLASRSAAYYQQGARFAKWRNVVSIPNGPSALAVKEAAWGLARYAPFLRTMGWSQLWSLRSCLMVNMGSTEPLKWLRKFGLRRSSTLPRTMSCLKVSCSSPAWPLSVQSLRIRPHTRAGCCIHSQASATKKPSNCSWNHGL